MANKPPTTSLFSKTITVYRNGDAFWPGIKFVVTKHQVPTFESLLGTLTSKINPPFDAIRQLYKVNGTKVWRLAQLEHGQTYVAAGYECFKKLDYGKTRQPQKNEPVTAHRKIKSQFSTINVFVNGEALVPSVPVKIPKNALMGMESVINLVAQKMQLRTGVNRLYTVDGNLIEHQMQLKNNEHYVAVGRGKFKPAPYGLQSQAHCTTKTDERSCAVPTTDRAHEVLEPVLSNIAMTASKKRKPQFYSISVYANGEAWVPPVNVKIPNYLMKRMENVITLVESKMGLRAGVSRLYTITGCPVEDPKDLKNNNHYVAVGRGRFKPAAYGQQIQAAAKNNRNECNTTSPAAGTVNRVHDVIKPAVVSCVKAAVHKNQTVDFCSIHVYANGEAQVPPVNIKIPKYLMKKLDDMIGVVVKKMGLRARVIRLHTLDGHLIKDPKEVKSHEHYVAVVRGPFKPAPYGQKVSASCKNKTERKVTPPAVQTTHHVQKMCADAGNNKMKDGRELTNTKIQEEPKEKTKALRVPVPSSAAAFITYHKVSLLGKGGFGEVYGGYRESDGKQVAIKYIHLNTVQWTEEMKNGKRRRVPLEAALMQKATEGHHSAGSAVPILLLSWQVTDDQLVLIMERPSPCCDLNVYVKTKGGFLRENRAKDIMRQLVRGAFDLHAQGIFHRDIKGANILVERKHGYLRARYIDFGCGTHSLEGDYQDFEGTFIIGPPELFLEKRYRAVPTTVWQLGVVMYNLLEGHVLFTTCRFLKNNLNMDLKVSETCKDFLDKCLCPWLEERADLKQLMLHPWLQ